jgi:hypothetical protein
MRFMNIPPFSEDAAKQLGDIDSLIKQRMVANVALRSEQSLRLISYMAWPNDEIVREEWMRVHIVSPTSERNIQVRDERPSETKDQQSDTLWATTARSDKVFLKKLKLIQQHWASTASILHIHYDMAQGGNLPRQGGASIGKAIHLIAERAKAKGTRKSKLWEIWGRYKDVSHLVTAAVLIARELWHRSKAGNWPLPSARFQIVHISDLFPDLILAVALTLEKYGLEAPVYGKKEPLFDQATLWRIPMNIGLTSVPLPDQKLRKTDISLLRARRAGNRGRRAAPPKTTPVSE